MATRSSDPQAQPDDRTRSTHPPWRERTRFTEYIGDKRQLASPLLLAAVLLAAPLAAGLPASVGDSGGWVQTAKLTAHPVPQIHVAEDLEDRPLAEVDRDDWFGQSMSLDGDVLAVGAPGDERTDRPGEVHVYERDGLRWTHTARLSADRPGDNFGQSVALDGDTLVVGAPNLDVPSDAAYVYTRTPEGWALVATFSGPGGFCFASSVAVHGDTLVVGAPCNEDVSAFLYERTRDGWVAAGTLAETTPRWRFGHDLALSEDLLVIGAVLGSAVVYERIGGTWTRSAVLPAQSSISVAVSGSRVALGDRSGEQVRIFEQASQGWQEVAVLEPPVDGVRDEEPWFGASVAFSGDGRILAVGASREDPTPPGTPALPEIPRNPAFNPGKTARLPGAVHIYELGQDGWTHQAKLSGADAWSAQNHGERFGTSVQVSPDGRTVLAGAPRDAEPWNPLNGDVITRNLPGVEGPCGISHFACLYRAHEPDAVYVFTHKPASMPWEVG